MSEPGKQARVQSSASGPIPDISGPQGTPGKSTLVGQQGSASASAIKDPYIEGRAHCDVGGAACGLEPLQRMKLVEAYQHRVESAAREFSVALAMVRFDQLIKKDDEMPLYLSLMLDSLVGFAVGSLSSAFKMIRSGSDRMIGMGLEDLSIVGGELDVPRPPVSFRQVIAGVDEGSVGFIIKAAGDQAKKAVKAGPAATDKAVALDYIGQMQDLSVVAWQHQREDPPGYASDGDLIALFHAFAAERGHTAPRYKVAIEEKLERYARSAVSRIGRGDAQAGRDPYVATGFDTAKGGRGGRATRDLKVVWVAGERGPTLYYQKLDASPTQSSHTMENLDVGMLLAEDDPSLAGPVELEFVESAIDNHRRRWGAEPEEVTRPKPWRGYGDLGQFVPGSHQP